MAVGEASEQALLFVEKKRQNNLAPGMLAASLPQPATSKSFLLLFFKKEALASFTLALTSAVGANGVTPRYFSLPGRSIFGSVAVPIT